LALIASAPEAPLDELAKKDIDVIGAYEGLQRRHFDETRLMITSVFGGMKTITHEIVAKDGKILELTHYINRADNEPYIIIDYANNGEYLRIKNIWIPTSKFCSNSKESKPRNVMCIISGKKHSDKRIANLFYVIDGGELNDDMEFRFDAILWQSMENFDASHSLEDSYTKNRINLEKVYLDKLIDSIYREAFE